MSKTVRGMRTKISEVYPSQRWVDRVKAMPPRQVIAIYHKFLKDGKFEKVEKEPEYRQMTIFDYI